jgi:ParB/RepB/Spo0J family partition protein
MGRKRLGVQDNDKGMAASVSRVAAPDEHAGAGRFAEIAVAEISRNDHNPRYRAVTPDQVAELRDAARSRVGNLETNDTATFFDAVSTLIDEMGLADSEQLSAEESRARLHSVAGLARSIVRVNLIQPITVYTVDGGYEVLAGQRRYLAHILLGRREIRAIVREPSGDALDDRVAAVIENLAREDLTLRERVEAIEEIVNLHEGRGETATGSTLQQYLGESVRTCQRYLRILREPAVRDGIRSGDVTSLRQAAQMVDPEQTGDTSSASGTQQGGNLTRSTPVDHGQTTSGEARTSTTGASKKKRATRPKTRVNLGATYNCEEVYRLLCQCLGGEELQARFPEVDWSNYADVEQAWGSFWRDFISARGNH